MLAVPSLERVGHVRQIKLHDLPSALSEVGGERDIMCLGGEVIGVVQESIAHGWLVSIHVAIINCDIDGSIRGPM